ncbi:MAG: sugar phosphate isomerase/epimerase [Candidatus Muirbacterium halophilum]|nr:sugar phosphate isomerase/epimerase [Candidatus Muirbacterium halophilum]MCK9476759.1 sugar phosphate isomerase/epimerase [Candidatus Muirbacterium halophilum]
MKFLLSDGCFYHLPLEKVFIIASKSGFEGVEIIWDGLDDLETKKIKKLIQKYQLNVPVVHEPFSFHKITGWPEKTNERLPYLLKEAENIGAEKIVVHTATDIENINWQLKNIPILQQSTNIKICMENMPEDYGVLLNISRRINKFYRKMFGIPYKSTTSKIKKMVLLMKENRKYFLNNPEQLKKFENIILDTTHLGTYGKDPSDFYLNIKDKIKHIHLSDFGPQEHLLPGKGWLKLQKFKNTLIENNYSETISLEVDPKAFKNADNLESSIEELKAVRNLF